jgi:hypothetical protein
MADAAVTLNGQLESLPNFNNALVSTTLVISMNVGSYLAHNGAGAIILSSFHVPFASKAFARISHPSPTRHGCFSSQRYFDPEVQGGEIALVATNNNIVQKAPNSLDRMHAPLPKQVAYNQRIKES